jgi:murein DD-endopeptidase MepM/ murein hydrolase activator NlpD
MARPQASGLVARADGRARARARSRRLRRLLLTAVLGAIVLALVILAFDSNTTSRPVRIPQAERLLPAGPPSPQVIAFQGNLRLHLPISESRVTALGYHGAGGGALALEPVGTQANAGLFTRLFNRLFGQDQGGIRYYLLGGEAGPETAGLDVGAPVGTDVYSPVTGTVIGISDRIISGKPYGVRIDLQPSGSPGLVVVVTNLEADPALTVGSSVAASRTKLGRLVDLSAAETSALAEHTQDEGQHVHLEVHPTANLSLP